MQAQHPIPALTAKPARRPFHQKLVQFVRLRSEDDLLWYQQRYQTVGGSVVSLDYLRSARVYIAFHRGNVLGGFIINTTGQLRYLEPFNQSQLAAFTEQFGIQFDQTAEITGIWLDARSKTHATRIQVYCASIWFAILSGKQFLLGGAKTESIVSLYREVMTIDLFAGQVTDLSGHSFSSFLCFQSRWKVVINAVSWLFDEYVGTPRKYVPRKSRSTVGAMKGSVKPLV
ncbi:hypothetical protein LZD49_31210 [Dyadobacter sp. CY261]|uniref:hypothetical protein n=1 Tax=Dyadobacter sp. CY261 TaxID=2907203 RepID=UPI001F42F860|nr:hypothetical protein [Dyadobacter sp. CY261]MCF0074995.1 hypothetical protein [Dyadobacter sp. CY261]